MICICTISSEAIGFSPRMPRISTTPRISTAPRVSTTPKASAGNKSTTVPKLNGSTTSKNYRSFSGSSKRYYSNAGRYNPYYVSRGYYGYNFMGFYWYYLLLGRTYAVNPVTNEITVKSISMARIIISWAITLIVLGLIIAFAVYMVRRKRSQ